MTTAIDLAIDLTTAIDGWLRLTEPIPVNVAIAGDALVDAAQALCSHIVDLGEEGRCEN